MSKYYPDEFKAELKERANIAQVIGQFTQLQPLGQNLFGLCPFHEDTRPSMQVKPETNTFYCHTCGAGSRNHSHVQASDVYGFLKGVLNSNLTDSIEWLANFMGVPLPTTDPVEAKRIALRGRWVEHCVNAAQRFNHRLINSVEGLNYFYGRGFTMADIILWQLGLGDDESYDFRNTKGRLVFSLYDYNGNLVSFTGRVMLPDHILKESNEKLKNEGKPQIVKYLDRINIKKDESYYQDHPYPEFDKRNHLYGIHIAKEFIRRFGAAVIVEGWTDVIKLHKFGVQHAVSTMGTALTEAQVMMIKRSGAKKAIIMRYGDKAGYEAALRDAKILMQHDIHPLIVPLEPGIDPCTLCDRFNAIDDSLNKFIDHHAVSFNQFRLKKLYQDTQSELLHHHSKIAYLQNDRMKEVIKILDSIDDPIEQDIFMRQASDLFVISYEAIAAHVSHYKRNRTYMVQ